MPHNDLDHYRSLYLRELTDNVIPFWERHCPDTVNGAFFTCLDRDGSVYDTEKFMWMQWRLVWMFSELYTKLEQKPEWLALAKSGFDFLTQHGRDSQVRYYFSLTADGRPTSAAHSVYSECFAVMGAAAYFRATGNVDARREALRAFDAYVSREHSPKGEFSKDMDGKARMKSLGFYMMKINLLAVLDECLSDSLSDSPIIGGWGADSLREPFSPQRPPSPVPRRQSLSRSPSRWIRPRFTFPLETGPATADAAAVNIDKAGTTAPIATGIGLPPARPQRRLCR